MNRVALLALLCAVLISTVVRADLPVVEQVALTSLSGDKWRVDVTVRHADSGWDHYANGWRVSDESGNELGFRVLHHPHVQEQPFTRSLSLTIPESVGAIRVQAVDSVHGAGEQSELIVIPKK